MTGNSRTPAARLLTIGGLIAAGERPLRTSAGSLGPQAHVDLGSR